MLVISAYMQDGTVRLRDGEKVYDYFDVPPPVVEECRLAIKVGCNGYVWRILKAYSRKGLVNADH